MDIVEQALAVVKQSDAVYKHPMITCAEVLCEVRLWQQRPDKLPVMFQQAQLCAVSQHTSPSGDVFWLATFLIDLESHFTGNLLVTRQQNGKLVAITTEALIANGGQQA